LSADETRDEVGDGVFYPFFPLRKVVLRVEEGVAFEIGVVEEFGSGWLDDESVKNAASEGLAQEFLCRPDVAEGLTGEPKRFDERFSTTRRGFVVRDPKEVGEYGLLLIRSSSGMERVRDFQSIGGL